MHRVAALASAVLLAVAAGCGSDDQDPSADPSPTANVVDEVPTFPPLTTAPPPSGPSAGLRDWIYTVGTDIPAGTYTTTVPTNHRHPCYWARLRSFGQADSIIDEGNPEPGERVEVTVRPTDRGFKVANGCIWTPDTAL